MANQLNRLVVYFIIVFGLFIYFNSFSNQFVWDDFSFVVKNEAIRSFNNVGSFFTDAYTLAKRPLQEDLYRPLLTLSFAIDYYLWKLEPRYYHLENVLFHIVNAILIYFLMKIVLKNMISSFLVSVLFLVHPAQTEVVDWITHRSDILALFFYLLCFLIHLRIRAAHDKKPYLYLSMLLLFAISLLFKEVVIILPLILILYDTLLLSYKLNYKKYLTYYTPFFFITLCYGLIRILVLGRFSGHSLWCKFPGEAFLTMCVIFARYFKILIFPKNLCADYVITLNHSVFEPIVIISIAALVCVFASALFLKNRVRLFSFGVFWFFISLMPGSNIFSAETGLAERYLYLPSIGFFIAIFGIILSQRKIFIKSAYFLMSCLIIICCFLTINRNKDWKDEFTFYKINSERSPSSDRMHYNLGIAYRARGMLDEAANEFKYSIRLNPNNDKAYNNLGNIYFFQDRLDLALECYKNATAISPELYEAYNNCGNIYFQKRNYEMAIKNYKKALALEKGSFEIHYNLSLAYLEVNRKKEAVAELKAVLELNPSDPRAAELLQRLNKEEKGIL